MRSARLTLTALTLTAALALSACGDDEPETGAGSTRAPEETVSPSESPSESPSDSLSGSPSASASESALGPTSAATVEVRIEGDSVSPMAQSLEVAVGEPVVLDITSDRAGELHAHSVPEQTVEIEKGQQQVEMTFERPGQVDIEEHDSHALLLRVLVK